MSLGADDYIAKPFSIAQLVLRVKAVLRRSRTVAAAAAQITLAGDVEIDTRNLSGRRGAEPSDVHAPRDGDPRVLAAQRASGPCRATSC